MAGPWMTTKKEREGEEVSQEKEKKSGEPIQVQIDRIRIQKGSIDFEDKKVGEPPAQIKLRDVNFEMGEIKYPLTSVHSPVQLKAKMEGKIQEGNIDIKGWIDAKTMDMETSLKVREIEVKTFEPYYRKRVTAEIESGYMDMDSKIAVKGKRIDAPGGLDLVNLRVKEGGGMVLWIPAETLVSILDGPAPWAGNSPTPPRIPTSGRPWSRNGRPSNTPPSDGTSAGKITSSSASPTA